MHALKTALVVAALALPLLFCSPAKAGNRADHWSGFDLGLGGTPFPSLAGLGLGFNIGDDARLSTGIGSFGQWATYNVDSKFFLADTPWAGYMGVGMSYMAGQHGTYLAWTFQFDKAFIPYFEVGVDFQSDVGIHVQFNLGASAPNGKALILPGVAIGWYF